MGRPDTGESWLKNLGTKVARWWRRTWADRSGGSDDALEPQGENRRREARYDLDTSITVAVDFAGCLRPVVNVSTMGLGFVCDPPLPPEHLGVEVSTSITVDGVSYGISLLPLHQQDGVVGCRLVRASAEWHRAVDHFVDPFRIGRSIREIKKGLLRPETDGFDIRWFQGGAGACDLFVWSDETGGIGKVQLFYYVGTVEWSVEFGLRTGRLQEDAHFGFDKRMIAAEADLYGFSPELDDELLTVARRLLSASCVPEEIQRYLRVSSESPED